MNKQKINQIVGSIGAFIGIIVFIAYIPQIIANLQGNKAQPFQPGRCHPRWIDFPNITLIEIDQRLNSTGSVFFCVAL